MSQFTKIILLEWNFCSYVGLIDKITCMDWLCLRVQIGYTFTGLDFIKSAIRFTELSYRSLDYKVRFIFMMAWESRVVKYTVEGSQVTGIRFAQEWTKIDGHCFVKMNKDPVKWYKSQIINRHVCSCVYSCRILHEEEQVSRFSGTPEANVNLDGGAKTIESQGIAPNQILALVIPWMKKIGLQSLWINHKLLPFIHAFD